MSNLAINRREMLKLSASSLAYVVGSQLFFGSHVAAETIQRFVDSNLSKFIKGMPAFDGVFVFDPRETLKFADDYGHFIHNSPLGVLRPANSRDIQKMLAYCSAQSTQVAMRGVGCSAYGQSQVLNGVVIDSSSLKSLRWLTDELVELSPGFLWREVLDFTIKAGRTPPVMPDTLVTTVGGKACVGGIGETSHTLGAIVDHIVEIDLALLDGTLITCSHSQNSKLFEAALGTMGQLGLITRVVLKTMPAPETVYSRQFRYASDATEIHQDIKVLLDAKVSGGIAGHFVRSADGKKFDYVLDVTSWEESPEWLSRFSKTSATAVQSRSFFAYAHRNTKGWNDGVAAGLDKLPRPFMSFFVPMERAAEMSSYLLNYELANLGAARIMMSPLLNSSFHHRFFPLPESVETAHFRIYRVVRSGEGGPEHLKMLEVNEKELVPKILALGGKVYRPFSPLLSSVQYASQYGELRWSQLLDFKRCLDPLQLLAPGA